MEHVGWNELLPKPYFIDADKTLFEHFSDVTREGITIAAPGFYAPQGAGFASNRRTPNSTRRSNRSATTAAASPISRWRARRWPAWQP